MSDIEDFKKRVLVIRDIYDELGAKLRNNTWDAKDYAMGFVGDVGDLMKLVAAKEGVRAGEDIDRKLAHELVDCLWSVLILAEHYGIDIDKEFTKNMDELEDRLRKEKAA